MQTLNFLKPNRDNIKNYSIIGSFLVLVSLIDVISNAFLKINLTSFLPGSLTTLFPLIFGLIGLNMMRIDYSGNKSLDCIRTNQLCADVIKFSTLILKSNGSLVSKLFMGEDFLEVKKLAKSKFKKVYFFKPEASRNESKETYLYCSNLKTL